MSQVWARLLEMGNCRSGCCRTRRASWLIASCAALCAGFSASCMRANAVAAEEGTAHAVSCPTHATPAAWLSCNFQQRAVDCIQASC